MAADILIYDADFVPVGNDQKQHVEITRDIAERFNNRYSQTFVVPQPLIPIAGARIMSLSEPTKKMSKSEHNDKGVIYMLDEPDVIRKKVMSAKTDMDNSIRFDPESKPGISNLLQIVAACQDISIAKAVENHQHQNYGEFKASVADIVIATLSPIQERYKQIITSDLIEQVLEEGKIKARPIAYKKLAKVQRKVGLEIRKK